MTDMLIDIAEAAAMLSISIRTLNRMQARGEVPVVRLSTRVRRFRLADIEALVKYGNSVPVISKQLVSSRGDRLASVGLKKRTHSQINQGVITPRHPLAS